eukprot:1309764-Pleurochrysis_carterae.AAC.1
MCEKTRISANKREGARRCAKVREGARRCAWLAGEHLLSTKLEPRGAAGGMEVAHHLGDGVGEKLRGAGTSQFKNRDERE